MTGPSGSIAAERRRRGRARDRDPIPAGRGRAIPRRRLLWAVRGLHPDGPRDRG
jgi:hypothetical protein